MGNVKENMKQIKVEFEKVFERGKVKVESQYNNLISGLGNWLDGGEISKTGLLIRVGSTSQSQCQIRLSKIGEVKWNNSSDFYFSVVGHCWEKGKRGLSENLSSPKTRILK